MAFSKTPAEDTYSSHFLDFTSEIIARDGGTSGRDNDFLNVFFEIEKTRKDKKHTLISKRPGTVQIIGTVSGTSIRGMFFWDDLSKFFYCVDNDIYVYNTQTLATATILNPFGTTTGEVGFCLFQYSTGITRLVATDGTTLITIDSANAVVPCGDIDLPLHLPIPIYLDGYIFVVKVGTADIYNSDNDNPLSWPGSSPITAELEGDNILRICKINNYIAAFGSNSIEYFWDAAAVGGSPLQRNDTPVKLNTYLAGLAQYGNSLFYIGINEGGKPDVYQLKDFKLDKIGSSTISRYLNNANTVISTWKGGIISCKGHIFYILNVGTERTYVYDVENNIWVRWGWKTNSFFNISQSTSTANLSNTSSFFSLDNSDVIYKFNDLLYQDSGITYPVVLTTPTDFFGTIRRKFMSRLSIIGDATSGNVQVQWSDNDGQTYSAAHSFSMNQDLPCVYRLGSFRQRSFKFTYNNNDAFRIQDVEVDINKGRA